MKIKKGCIFFVLFFTVISLYGCSSQKIKEARTEDYYQTVDDIRSNFVYEGFIEIMQEKTHLLALPLEYEAIDEAEDFLGRQKLFVYKSYEKGAIIMLQVTFSRSIEDEWNSSINYDSETFNSNNSKFGDFYNEAIPDIEVASNSFTYKGCHYNITSICGKNSSSLAAVELMSFSNKLIEYLTN
jgi:hypothetical protein